MILQTIDFQIKLAESEGFEPPEGITPQRFSRPPLSTAQPALQTGEKNIKISGNFQRLMKIFCFLGLPS